MSELSALLDRSLRERLLRAQTAGCECMVKTPIPSYHEDICKYRLCVEALEKIDQYQAAMLLHESDIRELGQEVERLTLEVKGWEDNDSLYGVDEP